MNLSFRWLRTLAPALEDTPARVAERLAMYGAPVDEIITIGDGVRDVVVARVLSVRRHPGADRLSLCEVDAGAGDPVQVVCGAPNVRAGALYPLAPVGARLPGGIEIRRAKIRGEESRGMLCSERELAIGRDQSGIMELPGTLQPGDSFVEAMGLDDVRLVVDVTPNRPDLLSHLGLARELAPGGVSDLVLAPFAGRRDDLAAGSGFAFQETMREGTVGGVRVTLEDTAGCPRYLGAVVRDVTIGPSPAWLAGRLRAIGLRPINNVVDATNYILHELGQPLHAFDLDRLAGRAIRVRRAAAGEVVVTLDGERRILGEEMTVIADAERPVAVAGVMGAQDSEVTGSTRHIFLECANFDLRNTRRTRTALNLSTDASYRFERGIDPDAMRFAAERALDLIVAIAGGKIDPVGIDLAVDRPAAPVIGLRIERVRRVLGVPLDREAVRRLLEPIGFLVEPGPGDALEVTVPGFRRHDVTREADLIEEVARRYGYDAFPAEFRAFRPSSVPTDPMVPLENRVRQLLVGRGFLEARTAAFSSEAHGDVSLLNPLSSAESRLRRSLVPGLLRQLEFNFSRGTRHVRLFEIGTVFSPSSEAGAQPVEATRVGIVMTGARAPSHWSGDPGVFDIWDLKALLSDLADLLDIDPEQLGAVGTGDPLWEPGFALGLNAADGTHLGTGGRIAPAAIDSPAWADAVWSLELTIRPGDATRTPRIYRSLPVFPAVERDAALLIADEQPAGRVEAAIRAAGGELLESVLPFDLYRGGTVPAGVRSIAFRLRFRASDRTLTDREVDDAFGRILLELKENLGVERRI